MSYSSHFYPETHVQFSPGISRPDSHAMAHISRIKAKMGHGLLNVLVHGNYEPPLTEGDIPKGVTLTLQPETVLDPSLLSDDLGTVTVLQQISEAVNPSDILSDQYFRSVVSNLQKIPVASASSPSNISLDVIGNIRDARPWEATLSQSGYVTVTKIEGQLSDDTYYLVVKTACGNLAQEIKEKLMKGPPMTIDKFIVNPDYIGLLNLSQRNAQRILFSAASLLGVRLVGESSEDRHAILSDPRTEPPQLASASMVNFSNIFLDHSCQGGACNYYSNTTPLSRAIGAILVDSSPISNKLLLVNPSSKTLIHSARWPNDSRSVDSTTPFSWASSPLPKYVPRDTTKPLDVHINRLLDLTITSQAPDRHIPSFALGTRLPPQDTDIKRLCAPHDLDFAFLMKPVIARV